MQQGSNSNEEFLYCLSGICYTNYAIITNCTNEGSLRIINSVSCLLAGICAINTGSDALITDCYSNQSLTAQAENLVFIGKFVGYMNNQAQLRVTFEENLSAEILKEMTETTLIEGYVSTTQTGVDSVVVKEVAINNNAKDEAGGIAPQEPVNDGYCYWKILTYPNDQYKYLESWFVYGVLSVDEGKENKFNIINNSGHWERLSVDNSNGWDYLKANGGYAYGYNSNMGKVDSLSVI